MNSGQFLLGVLVGLLLCGAGWHFRSKGSTLKEAIRTRLRRPRVTQGDALEPRAPEVEIQPRVPDHGNIRPVFGEEADPVEFGVDIHEFPEMKSPVTRFEDFNRRLFILHPAQKTTRVWPNTTADDFATRIRGMTLETAKEQIALRLRPRYPVILDTHGHWSWASAQLEQNPDFTDEIVSAYLDLPVERRPVVVSVGVRTADPAFTFIRYGFEDFRVTLADTRYHLGACLRYLMDAIFAPRVDWLWVSVARMRQTVIREFETDEALKRANEGTLYLEQEKETAKREREHQNRFVSLWQHRIAQEDKPLAADTEEAIP